MDTLNQNRPLSRRSLVASLGHMKYMVPRARLSLFVVTSNGLVPFFYLSCLAFTPPFDDLLTALYTASSITELTFDDLN